MNAIELVGVGKTFKRRKGDIQALKDISLEINQGEAFGFVGPNGAGKSTTIKVILDIISDYQGEIRIFGHSAREAEARRHVGYVPEAPALYEQLSPLEILRAGLSLHGVVRTDAEDWCLKWLDRFSIAHVARRRLRELSKGTVQRVALAHAMAIQSKLLILDEPLSGLDPIGRRDVIDILSEYKQGGGTLFFTSHVLHDVERLADRFGLIHKGSLRAVRSPAELIGEDDLVQIRSQGMQPIAGMTAEFSGRWHCEVPRHQSWQTLDSIQRAGHVLLEVKPTLSLESAFLQYVSAEDKVAADKTEPS